MEQNLFTFELGEITPGMMLEDGNRASDEYIRAGRKSYPDYLMKIYLKRHLSFTKESRRIANTYKKFVMSGNFSMDQKINALKLFPPEDNQDIFVLIKYRNCELVNGAKHARKNWSETKTEHRTEMFFLIRMPPNSRFTCWNTNGNEKRTVNYSEFLKSRPS